jgi:hypothetical protein
MGEEEKKREKKKNGPGVRSLEKGKKGEMCRKGKSLDGAVSVFQLCTVDTNIPIKIYITNCIYTSSSSSKSKVSYA